MLVVAANAARCAAQGPFGRWPVEPLAVTRPGTLKAFTMGPRPARLLVPVTHPEGVLVNKHFSLSTAVILGRRRPGLKAGTGQGGQGAGAHPGTDLPVGHVAERPPQALFLRKLFKPAEQAA